MYGSDWYMQAILPDSRNFLRTYMNAFGGRLPRLRDSFASGAALRFLGLDDSDNQNSKRLLARYWEHAPDRIPDWLAGVETVDPATIEIPAS